jgi:hypothetical protein
MLIVRRYVAKLRDRREIGNSEVERACEPYWQKPRTLWKASLHSSGSGQAARGDEASICGEATDVSIRRTPRGYERQRARTGWSRRPGRLFWRELSKGESITSRQARRESGRFIVARKRSNVRGAKGPN